MKISKTAAALALAAVSTALVLTGCSTTSIADGGAAPTGQAGAQQGGGGGGLTGEIAAVAGMTLQVQSTDEQTALTYTDSTTIDQRVSATIGDVTAGVCVSAFSGMPQGASSSSSSSSGSGAVTTVMITAATDSSCQQAGPAGAGGTRPTDPPTDMPSAPAGGGSGERPSGAPTGAPGGAGGGFVSGLVKSVSGSTITVKTTDGTETITVSADTAFTKTRAATADALVVGKCITATGKADTSGGYAATAITVSDKGENGCTQGFGGGRQGAGTGQPGAGQSGAVQSGAGQ